MLAVSLGGFSGKSLIYVICVCLLYTYCVFVLFFFVLCTLCWQFLWEGSYLRYLCLFTIHILCFCFVFLRLVYPMLAVSLGRLLFTLFVFVYYARIVFLFSFSSSCVPYVASFSGRALIYVICVCLLCTYCVFVLFFFVLCTLCWQFLWEGSYLRYLCLFTIHVLCFCFVFLRLVYPMLPVSLGGLLFTLFVFVYYKRIVFLFCFSSSCVPYVDSFSGKALIYVICVCLLYTYYVFVLFFFVYVDSFLRLLFTLFVFVYYTHIVFLFCFSSSCVPYVNSFSGRALIYVICACLQYTYCVFVLFFFVLCTLCWQFLWEGSYLRYLCLFTVHILCFCFVFLRLVYPMLAVSLGRLLFTLFVFVYYTHIVFLFCFSSSCVPYVGSFFGKALIYVICVCLLYTYCVFA